MPNYLEYGTCKSCKKETIFEYIGKQSIGILNFRFPLYNCLKCLSSTFLDKDDKRIKQLETIVRK